MFDSSSSDSELGERVKNVSKLLIKPKNEQQEEIESDVYKRKLGDLIFDASFESGNLGHVEQVDKYEFDLMVRPDVMSSGHRIWFNFKVSNQRPNQCVIFTFVNLSKAISLFHEGFTPVARSKSKPNWVRLHEDQVFYYKSKYHSNRMVLSTAFRFNTYGDEHQFALTYPYTYNKLNEFINRWQVELKRIKMIKEEAESELNNMIPFKRRSKSPESLQKKQQSKDDTRRTVSSLGFCSTSQLSKVQRGSPELIVEILAKSYLNKNILELGIYSNRDYLTGNKDEKSKVIIFCNSNGNLDSIGLLVCQGFIDFLLSNDSIAEAARNCIDTKVYPMLNPDSFYIGNSCTDLMGQTNLTTKFLNKSNHPNLYQGFNKFSKNVKKIIAEVKNKRVIIVQLKVNYNCIGCRILGSHNKKSDSQAMERYLALPRLMSRFASDFYLEHFDFYPTKSNKSDCYYELDISNSKTIVDQYVLEISPFGYYKRTLNERTYEEYNEEKYLRLGKSMVYSLLELLRPKDEQLSLDVEKKLNAFQPRSGDIDDLTLKLDSCPI